MAESAFPFSYSESNGCEYTAEQWRNNVKSMFTSGIIASYNGTLNGVLAVTAGTGMNVKISPGFAIVDGINYGNTADLTITLPSANISVTYDIILELDVANSVCKAKYKTRTTGSNIENDLSRTDNTYQIALATVAVPANTTVLKNAMITDQRYNTTLCSNDKAVCGIATAFSKIDTSVMTANFNSWFDSMKNQLSTDAAGNLQAEIDAITGGTTSAGNSIKLNNQSATYYAKQSDITSIISGGQTVGLSNNANKFGGQLPAYFAKNAVATQSANGLMSAADKAKLDLFKDNYATLWSGLCSEGGTMVLSGDYLKYRLFSVILNGYPYNILFFTDFDSDKTINFGGVYPGNISGPSSLLPTVIQVSLFYTLATHTIKLNNLTTKNMETGAATKVQIEHIWGII